MLTVRNTRRTPFERLFGCCAFLVLVVFLLTQAGCGQTRTSDTARTATEQLLISDAVDRAVSDLDFRPLRKQKVYLETKALEGLVDRGYLESTLKQHMLASELELQESKDKADYVVEARAGALGTGRQDVLYGVPAFNLPSIGPVGVATVVPEIPFAKRTLQQGVAKLAVFAYERETGQRVWQSGMSRVASNTKHLWLLGAGPFQSGTIYDGPGAIYANKPAPLTIQKKTPREDLPVAKRSLFKIFDTNAEDKHERLGIAGKSFAEQDSSTRSLDSSHHSLDSLSIPAKDAEAQDASGSKSPSTINLASAAVPMSERRSDANVVANGDPVSTLTQAAGSSTPAKLRDETLAKHHVSESLVSPEGAQSPVFPATGKFFVQKGSAGD